jgi:8-oxo-dGTP pyrophosphatase MutT (NUDIX family)
MGWNPDVTVAAVVMRDERFLVVEERIGGLLVLNQPAGHLEDGETLLEAAIREAREETAWRFTPRALVGTYLWRNPSNGRSFLRFAFCGEVDDHRPRQALDQGIVRTLWLTRADLQAQAARLRSPLVMRCIEDFLGGMRHSLDAVSSLDLETARDAPSVVNL